MAVYAVGDIQGCVLPFEELLEKINFDPEKDKVWVTGDIVNRGPDSLQALRLVKKFSESIFIVLGNHDLHLLAIARKIRRSRRGDTLKPILKAADGEELLDWLRHQPLVHVDAGLKTLMVHAGVYPGWSRKKLISYAAEVEEILHSDEFPELLKNMYGRKPVLWSEDLEGWDRYRFIVNCFTRMRYCGKNGQLNFSQKGPVGSQSQNLVPWFEHEQMKCKKWRIVFGHWSALGFLQKNNVISLDSGCVWGGKLTAVRLDAPNPVPHWQLDC